MKKKLKIKPSNTQCLTKVDIVMISSVPAFPLAGELSIGFPLAKDEIPLDIPDGIPIPRVAEPPWTYKYLIQMTEL